MRQSVTHTHTQFDAHTVSPLTHGGRPTEVDACWAGLGGVGRAGASWQQMAEVNAAIKAGGCHPKCPIACTHTGALTPPAPPIKDALMTDAEARVGDSAEAHENDGPDPFGDDMSNAPPQGELPVETPAAAADTATADAAADTAAPADAAAADATPADPADPDGPDGPEKAIIAPVLEEEGVDAAPAIDNAVDTANPDKVATAPAIGDAMLVNALMDDKNTPPSDADPTLLNSMAVSCMSRMNPEGRVGRSIALRCRAGKPPLGRTPATAKKRAICVRRIPS